MGKKRSDFSKKTEYLFARALISVLQRLPLRFSYGMGCGLGWLCWKFLYKRRAVVRKNLGIVNEWARQRSGTGLSGLDLDAQVREVFVRNGANLMSGFCLSRMAACQMEAHLEIEGVEVLREVAVEHRGAIILLAHMGPWEALAHLPVLTAKQGIEVSMGALYRPLNNADLDYWYKTQRESRGTRLFSRNDGFHKPVDFVRKGGFLGILADQKMREGVTVSYFGRQVKTSPIPGLFQRRSGAPMLALSIETIAPAKWRLTVDRVDLSALDAKPSREAFARVCNAALERVLSRSVCDGFWFHKRFK